MKPVVEFTLSDFDSCMCGDYRKDHLNGTGRCKMPNDLLHGFGPCMAFRFMKAATEIPEADRRTALTQEPRT